MANKKSKYPELNALKGRIREMRTTYRQLAEEMGMSVHSFSDKMNGHNAFTISEAEQICEILDIAPGDVVKFFMPTYQNRRNKFSRSA